MNILFYTLKSSMYLEFFLHVTSNFHIPTRKPDVAIPFIEKYMPSSLILMIALSYIKFSYIWSSLFLSYFVHWSICSYLCLKLECQNYYRLNMSLCSKTTWPYFLLELSWLFVPGLLIFHVNFRIVLSEILLTFWLAW